MATNQASALSVPEPQNKEGRMYSVNAPAADCDVQHGHGPDNAEKEQSKNELKIVDPFDEIFEPHDEARADRPEDIAAKILQMHVAAEDAPEEVIREPRLIAGEEEEVFEIPGVLRHPIETRTTSGLEPETVPSPADGSLMTGNSHRFKILALSALLIAAAGGATLIWNAPERANEAVSGSRPVETKLISATPTIEPPKQTGGDVNGVSGAGVPASASNIPASENTAVATPQQIEDAKNRIRQAFAAGNVGISTSQGQAAELQSGRTFTSLISDAQANLEQTVQSTGSDIQSEANAGLPVIVSNAGDVPIPGNLIPAGTETQPVEANGTPPVEQPDNTEAGARGARKPDLAQSENQAQPAAGHLPEGPVAQAAGLSYPNTGKTLVSLNLREADDKNAKIIGVIPANTEIQFNECGQWWCGVSYDGKSGYVGEKYLERARTAAQTELQQQ